MRVHCRHRVVLRPLHPKFWKMTAERLARSAVIQITDQAQSQHQATRFLRYFLGRALPASHHHTGRCRHSKLFLAEGFYFSSVGLTCLWGAPGARPSLFTAFSSYSWQQSNKRHRLVKRTAQLKRPLLAGCSSVCRNLPQMISRRHRANPKLELFTIRQACHAIINNKSHG